MKSQILLPLIVLLLLSCSSRNKIKYTQDIETPPGTIRLGENFFVDEAEITNQNWEDYLNWMEKYKEEEDVMLDTLVWRDSFNFNHPYTVHYHNHPAYEDYPIVGVNYEQALAYCEWRSHLVNYKINLKNKLITGKLASEIKSQKDFYTLCELLPKYFKYRLPTKKEWENFSGFIKNPIQNKNRKFLGDHLYNLHYDSVPLNKNAYITDPVFSYWPNKKGLYNVTGNVMEMVNEKGIAKGGSWKTNVADYESSIDYEYIKPTNDIGFRCVAEYVGK